jgi:hypothetical protein
MTNPAPQATLTDGSPFLIALSHDVPDDASPGMPLRFFASGDVRVGDFVVIRSGAPVVGEIAQASTPMTFRLVSVVAVDGKEYRVRALRGGGSSAVRPVRTAQTPQSKDLVASEGAEYIAYADGDITVEIKAPPPPAGKSRRKLSSNAR